MMKQNILLAGATILLSFLGNIVVTNALEWKKDIDTDRRDTAKAIIELQQLAKYLHGDVPAAPITHSPTLQAEAAK